MFSKIANAFKTAWQDLKKGLTAADNYLQANAVQIEAEIGTGAKIAENLLPAAKPIITAADTLEEAVMGELVAAVHSGAAVVNATDGTAAVTLSAGLTASLQALKDTLAGHPAVIAATATN
jgi:hypothetical protein